MMYWFDNQKHKKPHFHARYQGAEAAYDLKGNPLAGSLGSTADKLIKKWSNENANEIERAWDQAISGKELPWINPLQ